MLLTFLDSNLGDIHGNYILFYREKVKNATRVDMKPVKVYLTPELKQLIKEIGNPPEPDNYIFDCYKPGMTDEEMYRARKSSRPTCQSR